jgi:hypothetical protein
MSRDKGKPGKFRLKTESDQVAQMDTKGGLLSLHEEHLEYSLKVPKNTIHCMQVL